MSRAPTPVLISFLTVLVSALGKGLLDLLLKEGTPRDVLALLLDVLGGIFAVAAIAFIWQRRSWRGRWVRWPVTVVAVIALVYLIGDLVRDTGYRFYYAIRYLDRWVPPRGELMVAPHQPKIGDVLTLSARLENKPVDPQFFTCEWQITGLKWTPDRDCTVRYQLSQGDATKQNPTVPLRITLTVYSGSARWGSVTKTLNIHFAPTVSLRAEQSKIFVGQTIDLSALVDGRDPAATDRCQWTVNGIGVSQPCQWTYTGELEGTGRKSTAVKIEVIVFGVGGARLGRAQRSVEVVPPWPAYSMFVIDASRRMANFPGHWSGVTKYLVDRIRFITGVGQHAAVVVFGAPPVPPTTLPCNNIRLLFDFVPPGVSEAENALHGLWMGLDEAPLIDALIRGIQVLAPYKRATPDATLQLITITGGLDNCKTGDLAGLLADLRMSRAQEVKDFEIHVHVRVLRLMIVIANQRRDIEMWKNFDAKVELPHAVIVAADVHSLGIILDAVSALSAGAYPERKMACDRLHDLLYKQGHSHSVTLVRRHCDQLLTPGR